MFLLLAAPSAPAEVTVLHVSSRGAAMGTGASSPAALGLPVRGPVAARPPGQAPEQGKEGIPGVDGTHVPGAPSTLGQRGREGAQGPRRGASPICSLRRSPGMASSSSSWHCAGGGSNNTPTAQVPTTPCLPHHLPGDAGGARSCPDFARFPRHVLVTQSATQVPRQGHMASPCVSLLRCGLARPGRQFGSGRVC